VQRPSVAGTQEVNSIAFAPLAVTGGSHWSNWSAYSPPVLSPLLQQVTGNSMASLHPPQPPLPPTQGPQRYMPGSHLADRHEMATSHANRNSLFEWPAGVTPGAGLPSSSRTSPPASTCDAEDSYVFSGPPGRASSIPSLSPTGTDWHASRSPSSSASCQTTACNWWSCTSPLTHATGGIGGRPHLSPRLILRTRLWPSCSLHERDLTPHPGQPP